MTTNKILTGLGKSFGGKIVWLGGATAGIAAVLAAAGFLAIRAHHELLGITDLVSVPTDNWTIEGARFVYNSLFLMVFGLFNVFTPTQGISAAWGILAFALAILVLIVLAGSQRLLTRIHTLTKSSVVRGVLVLLTFAAMVISLAATVRSQTSHLLVSPASSAIEEAIHLRTTEAGITALKLEYAAFATLILLFFVWLKLLPQFFYAAQAETDNTVRSEGLPIWHGMLWFLLVIQVLLLPVQYGRLVMSNGYFKVCLLPVREEPNSATGVCAGHQGWLLNKDKDEIVLYQPNPAKPVQVFKQTEFKQLQVLTFANVFTSVPVTPQNLLHPSFGQTIINLGKFLRNIPQTLASGTMILRSVMPMQTLVLTDGLGQTLDVFRPFPGDERRSLQSPVYLPDQRILYVEIGHTTAVLKVVSILEGKQFAAQSEFFGTVALEGWEPQLTPDGQRVIFRQDMLIMTADLTGTEVLPLIRERQVAQILGVFPAAETDGYYIVFKAVDLPDQIAYIQGNEVLSVTPVDDDTLNLLPHLRVANNRLLYEKTEQMDGKMIWNIYLSETTTQEGRRMTNLKYPDVSPLNNRYPAWSPDGSRIVYASE